MLELSGVYAIACIDVCRVYIGSTVRTFDVRWNQHVSDLLKGSHPCKEMQADWQIYGHESFCFSVMACERDLSAVRAAEIETIKQLQSLLFLYNNSPGGGRPSLAERVQQRTGRDLRDLLTEYAAESRSPESIAGEWGCSVQSLIANAADYGFRIVTTRRIERRRDA
jgi:hypothetical protein